MIEIIITTESEIKARCHGYMALFGIEPVTNCHRLEEEEL